VAWAHFDEMSWPLPDERADCLENALRYDEAEDLTREDRLLAASIVAAYKALIDLSERERSSVVREIRQAMQTAADRG